MILTCKLAVSNLTGARIMSLVHDGQVYFRTLGDLEGIHRLREWAKHHGYLIDTRTLPRV